MLHIFDLANDDTVIDLDERNPTAACEEATFIRITVRQETALERTSGIANIKHKKGGAP